VSNTLLDPRIDDARIQAHDPGDVIGYRLNGEPIYHGAGAAEANFDHWIPEEFGSTVIQRVNQMSAIEAHAQRVPMASQTRSTPRSGGVAVGIVSKGGTYAEDTTTNDEVILNVQKFGQAIRIAEEDINDSLADIVNAKQTDWATSYAKALDVACLGVNVAKATSGCKFDSLYYTLTQTDSNTGYTGMANITQTATGAPAVTYANLSAAAGLYESGDYFDEGNTLAIAHPKYKALLRGVVDTQGRPIFQEGSTGVPGGGQGNVVDTIFGYPVKWSLGARTNATVSQAPTGNPLLVFGNPLYLLLGIRSGPESVFIDGRNGLGALTDESILKMRSRRGFAVGHPGAFSILEQRA
jgi:HK97 family phage major capsid protein